MVLVFRIHSTSCEAWGSRELLLSSRGSQDVHIFQINRNLRKETVQNDFSMMPEQGKVNPVAQHQTINVGGLDS